jgi:CHRD domain-containing protein
MADGKTVVLTLAAPLNDGTCYKLTVNNVKDCAGNSIQANSLTLIKLVGSRDMIATSGGNHMVVVEAEDLDGNNSPQNGISWTFGNSFAGYSGTGYMESLPDAGVNAGNVPLTPRLWMDYCINFPTAGNYYFLLRGSTDDSGGAGNSVHISLDGVDPNANENNRIGNDINDWGNQGGACATPLGWGWVFKSAVTTQPSFVTAPSAGLHTFRIWFREDGLKLDQFVLTSDPAFALAPCDAPLTATPRVSTSSLRISLDCTNVQGDTLIEWDDDTCKLQTTDVLHSNPAANVWTDIATNSPYRVAGFTVDLDAAQEVPANGGRTGTGKGTISLCGTTLTINNITFSGLSGNTTMAHIHGIAMPGVNAGVLYPLTITPLGATSGSINGTVALVDNPNGSGLTVAQQLEALSAGKLYVNIHTSTFGGGEIRGQVLFRTGNRFYRLVTK